MSLAFFTLESDGYAQIQSIFSLVWFIEVMFFVPSCFE